MIFIRSLLFSLVMIISTILITVSLVLISPLPYRWVVLFSRLYPVSIMFALKYICNLRYEVTGRENIPEQTSIIFCKHQSTWETLAVQVLFPPMVFVVKRELLWLPFFGWGLAALRAIAINRSAGHSAVRQMIKKGTARLKRGIWVTIFPEGTRVTAGSSSRYHIGGAILAARSGYPVVPVAHNAGEFWPRGRFLKKPGTIQIVIGPQIPSNNRRPEKILADAKNWIEATVAEISSKPEQKD